CNILQIRRSTYYYEAKNDEYKDEELTTIIVDILKKSRNIYGKRTTKKKLEKLGSTVCLRRMTRIKKEQDLVSKYTVAQFKPTKSNCNESEVGNVLNREFNEDQELKVVVSDLTYVRVDKKGHYICILVDLYNREIIGYSAGPNKTAA